MSETNVQAVVQKAIAVHGSDSHALITILSEVNRNLGYLPADAMTEVCRLLHLPDSHVHSVATFYSMLTTKKRGRHVIQFCENAPCHVIGGRKVWNALRDELDLANGETTPNGKWTLITTSCIGICAVGPVLVVDDDVYGNVDAKQVKEILAKYS